MISKSILLMSNKHHLNLLFYQLEILFLLKLPMPYLCNTGCKKILAQRSTVCSWAIDSWVLILKFRKFSGLLSLSHEISQLKLGMLLKLVHDIFFQIKKLAIILSKLTLFTAFYTSCAEFEMLNKLSDGQKKKIHNSHASTCVGDNQTLSSVVFVCLL